MFLWLKQLSNNIRAKVYPGIKISDEVSYLTSSSKPLSGVDLTPETSLSHTAVLAAVRRIAQGIAMLPLHLYQRDTRDPRKKTLARDNPLYYLLHDRPNPEQTSFEWREMMQASLLVRGNCYAEIESDKFGNPIALWALRSDQTWVERKDGIVLYHTVVNGREYILPAYKVFHIKGFSTYGLVGLCIPDLCKDAIGTAIAQEQYQATFFGNSAEPRGLLEYPGVLKDEARRNLRNTWQETHGGLTNQHRIAILEEGLKFAQTGVSNVDAELIAGRTFQLGEIARLFDIPPHLIGDLSRATFTNIEQQSLEYVMFTLAPWVTRWEQRLNHQIIPAPEREKLYTKFNVNALLRGDITTRTSHYVQMVSNGIMSRNDVRELEDLNPIGEEGDLFTVQLNLIPLRDLEDTQAAKFHPAPETEPAAPESAPAPARAIITPAEYRETAGQRAAARLRFRVRYRKILKDAFTRLVRAEMRDVKAAVQKHLKRDRATFADWMKEYYGMNGQFRPLLAKILKPSVYFYAEEGARLAAEEIERDSDSKNLDQFVDKYLNVFSGDYIGESVGTINRSIEAGDPAAPEISAESAVDKWGDARADFISADETVALSEAIARDTFIAAGVPSIIWNASPSACPLCQRMAGRSAGKNAFFVDLGGKVDPVGEGDALTVSKNIGHAPLHSGCGCFVTAGS